MERTDGAALDPVIQVIDLDVVEGTTTVWLLELSLAIFCWELFNLVMDLCRPVETNKCQSDN